MVTERVAVGERFATWQILVSIFLFPIGLLALAAGRKTVYKDVEKTESTIELNVVPSSTSVQGTSSGSNAQITAASIPADDEQKCPFCAEIIKKEAKICRFCHSSLVDA